MNLQPGDPDGIPGSDHSSFSPGPEGDSPFLGGPGDSRDHDREAPSEVPAADPWAHRRGEPRVFALLWSTYVLLAVAGGILWLMQLPPETPGAYSPAARTLLVVLAAGLSILWPMTRLSQLPPDEPSVHAALADTLLMLIPIQMVIWPLWSLAGWPIAVVAAVASLFLAWGLLIGAVQAIAFARGEAGAASRAVWMGTCIVLVVAAPCCATLLTWAVGASPKWLEMGSPFTSIFALSGSGYSGPTTAVTGIQWSIIAGTGVAAVLAWTLAAARAQAGSRRVSGLH
ncbi:MAG: hypothetical protein KF745_01305 [Phycisphaeraceae bacterium]|nr:hypothetical protein [Phycisphaeraceae bacterium]